VANSSKAASVVGTGASRIHTRPAVGRPAPYIAMSPSTPIVSNCRWKASTMSSVCAFSILPRPPNCSGSATEPSRPTHRFTRPIAASVTSTMATMRPTSQRRRAGASKGLGVRVHAGGAAGIPGVHGPRSGGEPPCRGGVWYAPKGW
jgi:hypothetical protein